MLKRDKNYKEGYDYKFLSRQDIITFYFWSCAGILNIATFLTFLILKLFSIIEWSWWWVTSPLWVFYGIVLIIISVINIVNIISGWIIAKKEKK